MAANALPPTAVGESRTRVGMNIEGHDLSVGKRATDLHSPVITKDLVGLITTSANGLIPVSKSTAPVVGHRSRVALSTWAQGMILGMM